VDTYWGWVLAAYGYQEPIAEVDQPQTSGALDGILLLMTLFPVICGIVVYIRGWRYRLTSARLIDIQTQLKERS